MIVLCLTTDFVILLVLEGWFSLNKHAGCPKRDRRYGFKSGRGFFFGANSWLLLLVALALIHYKQAYRWAIYPPREMTFLLFGIVLGKGVKLFFKGKGSDANESAGLRRFLIILILSLSLLSAGHQVYNGRWAGFLDNPDDYGILMGAGLLLAAVMIVERRKTAGDGHKLLSTALFIATGMMATGMLLSYSRGAWLGAATGFLYLAKEYNKFRWRYVLAGTFAVATILFFFWNATPSSSPWYLKRLDLSRPSAQHRVAAWHAGFKMMWDHPFGVGWNRAVETYEEYYSPPKRGGAAMATNDYLILGTELGIAAPLCFLVYVSLCLRGRFGIESGEGRPRAACRAGGIVLLVGFWFDGGLFKLATASTFWILLELGSSSSQDLHESHQNF